MILLDTDHLSTLKYPDKDRYTDLVARMNLSADQDFAITVISVEEQFRGWMAAIARERQVRQQVRGYREMAGLFDFLGGWTIAPFDDQAADEFKRLRARGPHRQHGPEDRHDRPGQ